jgi:hypothetical protein
MTYQIKRQLSIDDFIFPYGRLSRDNRWVRLAELIPWDEVEREYAAKFVRNGAPAHPARMALGALIIKQMIKCSDEELVNQVTENPYLQFFIGLKEFSDKCPFGASTLVAFRKRFSDSDIASINEMVLRKANEDSSDDDDSDDDPPERTMAIDATVAPADITYPQDMKLLNKAREHIEKIIKDICAQTGAKRPRMYKNKARKDYLNWSKSKRRSAKMTRKAIRRQLGYLRRDLSYLDDFTEKYAFDLTKYQLRLIEVIKDLYDQQLYMYENRTHSVPNRIVSIPQPHVRPIVRGKANASTEFGAKVSVATDDEGFAKTVRISFDAYNESEDLIPAVEKYYESNGRWPERVLADKIFRTRDNLAWCKERNIRLSGPKLGRPPKDSSLTDAQKQEQRKDSADRNVVEGAFGTMKTAYGLDPVRARLEETSRTVIALAVLVFNLKKLLGASLTHLLDVIYRVFWSIIRPFTDRSWSTPEPYWSAG